MLRQQRNTSSSAAMPQVRLAEYGAALPLLPDCITVPDLLNGVGAREPPALLRLVQELPVSHPFLTQLSNSAWAWDLLIMLALPADLLSPQQQQQQQQQGHAAEEGVAAVAASAAGSGLDGPEAPAFELAWDAYTPGVGSLQLGSSAAAAGSSSSSSKGPSPAAAPAAVAIPPWLVAAQVFVALLERSDGPLPRHLQPAMLRVGARLLSYTEQLAGCVKPHPQAVTAEAGHEGASHMDCSNSHEGPQQHQQLQKQQLHVALLFQQLLRRMLSLSGCAQALVSSSEVLAPLLRLAQAEVGPPAQAVSVGAEAAAGAAAAAAAARASAAVAAAATEAAAAAAAAGGSSRSRMMRIGLSKRRALAQLQEEVVEASPGHQAVAAVTYYQVTAGLMVALGHRVLMVDNPGAWQQLLEVIRSGSYAGGAVLGAATMFHPWLKVVAEDKQPPSQQEEEEQQQQQEGVLQQAHQQAQQLLQQHGGLQLQLQMQQHQQLQLQMQQHQLLQHQQQAQQQQQRPPGPYAAAVLAAAAAGASAAAASGGEAAAAYSVSLGVLAESLGGRAARFFDSSTRVVTGHPWSALQCVAAAGPPGCMLSVTLRADQHMADAAASVPPADAAAPAAVAGAAEQQAAGDAAGGEAAAAVFVTACHHLAGCLLQKLQGVAAGGSQVIWELLQLLFGAAEVATDFPCWHTPDQVAAAMLAALNDSSPGASSVHQAVYSLASKAAGGMAAPRTASEAPPGGPEDMAAAGHPVGQRRAAWRAVLLELLQHSAGRAFVARSSNSSLEMLQQCLEGAPDALGAAWQLLVGDPSTRSAWVGCLRSGSKVHDNMLANLLGSLPHQQVLGVPEVLEALQGQLLSMAANDRVPGGRRVLQLLLGRQPGAWEEGGPAGGAMALVGALGGPPEPPPPPQGLVILDAYPQLLGRLVEDACPGRVPGGREALVNAVLPLVPTAQVHEQASLDLLASSRSYMALFPLACMGVKPDGGEAARRWQLTRLAHRPEYQALLMDAPDVTLLPLISMYSTGRDRDRGGDMDPWEGPGGYLGGGHIRWGRRHNQSSASNTWVVMEVLTALPRATVGTLLLNLLQHDSDTIVSNTLAVLAALAATPEGQALVLPQVRSMARDAGVQGAALALQQAVLGLAAHVAGGGAPAGVGGGGQGPAP